MNKKLIALVLCILTLLSVCLTSCGETATEETNTSKVTLNMLTVTENQVYYTDEELAAMSDEEKAEVEKIQAQYTAVTEQINKVTKAKYNTALNIFYYTADQYYEALESKMLNTKEKIAASDTANKAYKAFGRIKENKKLSEVEKYQRFAEQYPEYIAYIAVPKELQDTPSNEEIDEDVYPEVDIDQVDILFIGDYDKYIQYIEEGWLEKLNDQLNSNAKKLTSYVYPAFLNAVKIKKGYYAIPNNTVIGQYTSLLVNKRLCDKYDDISRITSLSSAMDLIEMVAKYEKDVDPVWCNSFSGITNVHYWSIDYTEKVLEDGTTGYDFIIDPEQFSCLGAVYNPDFTSKTADPNVFPFGNLLEDSGYTSQLIAQKTIELSGYRGEENSTNEFAVGVIKGSGEEIAKYSEDYYNVILEYPVATEDDLFGSMYGVSKYSSSVARSMEIITYLNTNSDFRNLFQYGIKDTNYKLNSEGCAVRLEENLYNMNIYKTGNIFIAYPDADVGMTYQTLENAKKQDLDVVTNPALGFVITSEMRPDLNNLKTVKKASEEFKAEIDACKTIEELESTIRSCVGEIKAGIYKKAISQKAMYADTTVDSDYSAYALYTIWAREMGYIS